MIVRSRTVISALLGAIVAVPVARAENITRGGQPAELTVTQAGAHSVRVTLKPVGMVLPPNPSLLNLEIKNPAISLRMIERSVRARVGELDVEITPLPLTVLVKNATGREIQKLVFDVTTGKVSFSVGDAPVLGMGEGGQQAGRGSRPMGVQFDRRGKLDVMRRAGARGRSARAIRSRSSSAPSAGACSSRRPGCRSICATRPGAHSFPRTMSRRRPAWTIPRRVTAAHSLCRPRRRASTFSFSTQVSRPI